jgi:hypothetical protein
MVDQLEFDFENDVEETLTLVKLLVTYPSPHDLDVEETAFHQFLDYAPHFEGTNDAINSYMEVQHVKFKLWYLDPPEPLELSGTHAGTLAVQ